LTAKGSARVYASLALAVVLATVFGLSSFAAADTPRPDADPVLAEECSGSLTINGGSVSVNGNDVQTGATILTGSIVATSSNGHAMIDFGPVGKLELGTGTTVTVTCLGRIVHVRSNCSRTFVKVRVGKVDVTQPKVESIEAGKEEEYKDSVEATAATGTDWLVDCQRNKPVAYIGPGIAALIGLGTVVAVGVKDGGHDRPEPTSPIK